MSDDKKIMKTLNGYTVYDEDAHRRIDSLAGSAPGLVFDTVADMEAYVAEHSAELKVGQNLYIREVDVPDYWWDGTAAQELETKVDLSGYAKQEEVDRISEAIADKLGKSGGTLGGKFVIPTADTKAGFVNSEDMKIFGYGTNNFRMGDPNKPLELRGSGTNPMFGSKKILVEGDITGGLLSVETITIGDGDSGETETIPVT